MLILTDVHKSFGDSRILNGVDLHLERRFVYTLRGGSVEFKGKKISCFAPFRVNRLGIGRTFQDLRLASQMSVYENILLALEAKLFAYPTKEQQIRVGEILEKVSLSDKRDELAGEISYGQQKLLTLGCCIANNAELLLIDEPVAGIDKDNLLKITELVGQLKREGKTILQIEHNQNYIDATSDHVFVMEKGRIAC